jgi:uncharacterized membrane protein YphA (DoxX/SURF4 family)
MFLFYASLLITLLFFTSGLEKLYTFSKTVTDFAKKTSLPLFLSQLVISGVIVLEIIAPILVATYAFTGFIHLLPWFKISVMALIAFTILATLMYHNPIITKSYRTFINHLSIIGGLLLLYNAPAGMAAS